MEKTGKKNSKKMKCEKKIKKSSKTIGKKLKAIINK